MKKRLIKKFYKRVAEAQKNKKEVPFFYVTKVRHLVAEFIDHRYLTVFRPYWYEQLENCKRLDFMTEHKKHYEETFDLIRKQTNIDLDLLSEDYKSRRRIQTRKPAKPKKPKPVRKLRNPRTFAIRMINGEYREVTGEIAFKHGNYEFFIYHDPKIDIWIVSDVTVGAVIARHIKYNLAVIRAEITIKNGFDRYKEFVNRKLEEFKQAAN
ncbi:hypothetical protein BK126_03095 [Paenibacillus sp. FSL H7-0326]|uniref:hypothetical protein n=1 Tax=Paenibacillus sp. FSL H7-0326 TaxID=1921144 RepID=UPI00096BF672|nr:hypothetical protein [Paenibacillus sp. FSL H7-0326]OMC71114.1 hypothetical protein BK126_03095 [Paenibacillus sp. FSL H7-0326]